MDGSRVLQSLDSLWFYTNILTCRDEPVASLTHQFTPLIHAKEPPKNDSETPNSAFLLNQQNESEIVETFIPCRPKDCELASESETERVIPVNMEMLGFGRGSEKKERRRRRRRRRKGRKIHAGLELGFEVKFDDSCGFQRLANQLQTRMLLLPYHDDIAMKEHLKSWAYAVACTVK